MVPFPAGTRCASSSCRDSSGGAPVGSPGSTVSCRASFGGRSRWCRLSATREDADATSNNERSASPTAPCREPSSACFLSGRCPGSCRPRRQRAGPLGAAGSAQRGTMVTTTARRANGHRANGRYCGFRPAKASRSAGHARARQHGCSKTRVDAAGREGDARCGLGRRSSSTPASTVRAQISPRTCSPAEDSTQLGSDDTATSRGPRHGDRIVIRVLPATAATSGIAPRSEALPVKVMGGRRGEDWSDRADGRLFEYASHMPCWKVITFDRWAQHPDRRY